MLHEIKDILRLLDRFVGHYPIYFYLVDSYNTISWFNRYMSENMPEVRLGQTLSCHNVLSPCKDICPECQASDDEIVRGKVQKKLIKANVGPGDAEKHIEFFSFPILSKNDKVRATLRIGLDVTENEKLQEKLRNKEKLFTAIVNTSSDAVIFLDVDDKIKSWNRGAEDIFGYTEDEIIGESIQLLLPEKQLDAGELDYIENELSTKGSIKKYETQRRHKTGRIVYVDISSTRIFDENSNLIGTSKIIKDVDSRKKLEFELLRTILELSKVNELNEILQSTYEKNEILRIILIAITAGEGLRFNRAFVLTADKEKRELKGHLAIGPSNKEEAGRIWNELNEDFHYLKDIVDAYNIDPDGSDKRVNDIVEQIHVPFDNKNHILMRALTDRRVLQVKDGAVVSRGSFDFTIGNTDIFSLLENDSFIIAPIFTKKESLGLIIADNCINHREITTEDIEGLKLFANQASSAIENAKLYQALEIRIHDLQDAYQKLEENQEKLLRAEKLATIGEMSAKVAHEIRNPLVSIGGFARLIERKIEDNSPIKQYASIIKEQVDNLENILSNVLGAANPPVPQKKLVDLNKVVHQGIQVMENAIGGRNHKLILDLKPLEHPIEGDTKLLNQAVMNLLKNAVEALDARSEGGEIHIRTHERKKDVELQIADNGAGIEGNILKKIFKAFYTTKSSGSGLGLSIVNQIVESHNGTIDVKTKAKKGTTFFLRFPFASKEILEKKVEIEVE